MLGMRKFTTGLSPNMSYVTEHSRKRYNIVMVNSKMIGRYIVLDPRICHGKSTFRGTRIMVSQVLEQVTAGIAWETIAEEWRGNVPKEAIAEAVRRAVI